MRAHCCYDCLSCVVGWLWWKETSSLLTANVYQPASFLKWFTDLLRTLCGAARTQLEVVCTAKERTLSAHRVQRTTSCPSRRWSIWTGSSIPELASEAKACHTCQCMPGNWLQPGRKRSTIHSTLLYTVFMFILTPFCFISSWIMFARSYLLSQENNIWLYSNT